MTATILRNNLAIGDAVAPPATLNANGEPVQWRIFFDDLSKIADSDNLTDLVAVLIRGYAELDEKEQLEARIEKLLNVKMNVQTNIYANLYAHQENALTDEEKMLLLNGQYDLDFREADGQPLVWTSKTPLVMIDMFYEPHTQTVAPVSSPEQPNNIIWLQGETELDFLLSLHKIGLIAFGKPTY